MNDRMNVMNKLLKKNMTHECPSCSEMTYCAMTDGKSVSTCWCFVVQKDFDPETDFEYDECLCKQCLENR